MSDSRYKCESCEVHRANGKEKRVTNMATDGVVSEGMVFITGREVSDRVYYNQHDYVKNLTFIQVEACKQRASQLEATANIAMGYSPNSFQ